MNFYFAIIGLPLSLFVTIYTGEINELIFEKHSFQDVVMILLSGMFGILLTINYVLMVSIASPLSPNIAGTIKDVALTYFGFIFFNDVKLTLNIAVGISISFIGASYFAYSKYLEHISKDKKKNK